MKKIAIALVAVALCASVSMANIPVEANCSVQPADALNGFVVAPLDPAPLDATVNTINVRNEANAPIPDAAVTIEFSGAINVCTSTVLAGVTDASGDVVLTLGAGGCANNVALSGVVKANGVTIRSYANVKSPDYDGAGGDKIVGIGDLVIFSNEFLGSSPAECHDYDNNLTTGIGDLIIFSEAFVAPSTCN